MAYQVTDPVEIERALSKLMNYAFLDEVKSFEEQYPVEFHKSDSIEDMIEKVKSIKGGKDHILYSMLVLKSAYPEIQEEE